MYKIHKYEQIDFRNVCKTSQIEDRWERNLLFAGRKRVDGIFASLLDAQGVAFVDAL